MHVEKITRDGKDFAVIAANDLQKLIDDSEMLSDVQAYDAAKTRLEQGVRCGFGKHPGDVGGGSV